MKEALVLLRLQEQNTRVYVHNKESMSTCVQRVRQMVERAKGVDLVHTVYMTATSVKCFVLEMPGF